MQPNFFIVGAPKAGTTSLYHYLDQHPQVYMSPIKEPNYFASEVRAENFDAEHQERIARDLEEQRRYLEGPMSEKRFGALGLEWDDYLKLFRNARDEKAIGEASVCYLWSESAAANIFQKIPDARILMILRDPAERAFSQYMQWVTKGVIRHSFREQVDQSLRNSGGKFELMHPFLEMGLYHEQVKRYLDLFPLENVRILFYDDYRDDAPGVIADVLRFLGVDAEFAPDMSRRHLAGREPGSTMDARDRAYLASYYREDVQRLAALLDRDLSRWLP
ncbi:MAG: sulfotransferase domain-containing protein [Acidobacteriia bacterium]|nr:sulfotransferase domain-containing protein [Terriglobia bacterium]